MLYKTIKAGELRKMDGKKCRLETNGGVIIEDGIISINEDGSCFVVHNNEDADGRESKDMRGKRYGWIIYLGRGREGDDCSDNMSYNWIEIEN